MKKLALVIGIGTGYPDPYKITSTKYDVVDVTNTLVAKGFSVTKLLDTYATKVNILNYMANLVGKAYSGDSIVIVFIGHGTYLPGNTPDGRMECICPCDINVRNGANAITDVMIANILLKLRPGVSCDFVNGVCFSGTSTRADSLTNSMEIESNQITDICIIPGIKIPYEENPVPTPEPIELETDRAVFVPILNHVLWAASASNEYSYGVKVNGIPRNIYVYLWCAYIRTYGLVKSRWQIDNLLTYKLLSIVPQHCQLEGPSKELYQKPFT